MEMISDNDLLQLAKNQDLPALTAIYDRYNQALYYFALRLLGDQTQAEDCVAETFSRFLKAMRAGQGPNDNLKAYLYRSAHNWVTDQYRRQPISNIELSDELPETRQNSPSEQAELNINGQKIRAALGRITNEQRQVVILRFVEGWEFDEIAASLKRPVGAIKALQYRAIASLRNFLLEEKQADFEN
jgi:RNA polymerase sigma-70 factor (ECF subfamily)